MKKQLSRHPILTGTLILSITNITTRIIGFLYRVYLSRMFDAEGMGIIQLSGPISAMVYSLSAAGMQTAISKCVSSISVTEKKKRNKYLYWGLFCALLTACICSFFVYRYADFFAVRFLTEPRTAPILRILALSYPLSAVHACINGYYIGKQETLLPAASQLTEQLIRVTTVYLCCTSFLSTGDTPQLAFTAWGVLMGEAAALCVVFLGLYFGKHKNKQGLKLIPHPLNEKNIFSSLLKISAPLSANRLAVNFLQSIEAVRIPLMLQVYGLSDNAALSTYGILTGMAFPVVFFPGAFTGALSQMLLPTVSEAHSKNDYKRIRSITTQVTFFVVFAGLLFGILIFMFSDFLGTRIFHEPLAASYIRALCMLCPFMYLNGVFTGILQGLGKVMSIFFINVTGLFLRLLFVFLFIPKYGIKGYFIGVLVSQLYSTSIYLYECYKTKSNE